jgi:hypothetical protein
MKSWKLEFRLVESGRMLAKLANWSLDVNVEANSPERAVIAGLKKCKKELNSDRHLKRAKRLGGLRIKCSYLGEVDTMKLTEEEVRDLEAKTGKLTSRKCDHCLKPIYTSYVFKPRGIQAETCSPACREAMEAGESNEEQNKETNMKSKAKKTKKANGAEAAVETTAKAAETTEAKAPETKAAKTSTKKPAAEKAAKPAKAAKATEAAEDSPRKQLAAIPYADRMKGKFDKAPGHPLAIFLDLLGGPKGDKTVKLTVFEKACPEGFEFKNMLKTLDWYGNPANEKEGVKGFGRRVKIDNENGTVTLVKADA